MSITQEQKAKNQAFLQARYEELAEAWAIETDQEEEDKLLLRIMDLKIRAEKDGYKICLHDWIKQAIYAWMHEGGC